MVLRKWVGDEQNNWMGIPGYPFLAALSKSSLSRSKITRHIEMLSNCQETEWGHLDEKTENVSHLRKCFLQASVSQGKGQVGVNRGGVLL